ncbi:hypothetical protein LIER_43424 [Lithospermum erythrorhizon]|uniref:Uncharacterized protein n=1 Tax=Lithospermum erythrorhizon TaxID=34254 RepID=A0AAV3Q4E2_LITER
MARTVVSLWLKPVNLVNVNLIKFQEGFPKRKGSTGGSRAGQSFNLGKSTGGNENFTAMISEINMIQEDND